MIFMRMTLFKKMLLGNIQADALRHYLQADAAYLKRIYKLICFVNSKMNSMNDVKIFSRANRIYG